MRACEISGWGSVLPDREVTFGRNVRYRVSDGVGQLDMLSRAAERAIESAGMAPRDIDCVIGAVAAGVQPIPCTAALVMERVAPDADAAAFDVNSTCTSFITAFDVASRLVADGEYGRILIVSGDVGTRFLNPDQRESYELFSDAAAAVVLTAVSSRRPADVADADRGGASADPDHDRAALPGVLASLQRTWPRHAHDTELRGGLSAHPAQEYATGDPADYLFDMHGRRALMSMLKVLPGFFDTFFDRAGLGLDDIDLIVPHQASGALGIAMRRIGIPPEKYVDRVAEFGNMVSSSVPFMLIRSLEEGRISRGDTVLLCGTAAGLTANALALRL